LSYFWYKLQALPPLKSNNCSYSSTAALGGILLAPARFRPGSPNAGAATCAVAGFEVTAAPVRFPSTRPDPARCSSCPAVVNSLRHYSALEGSSSRRGLPASNALPRGFDRGTVGRPPRGWRCSGHSRQPDDGSSNRGIGTKVTDRWWLNCVAGDQVTHSCWR
jgi:hypothetical protein